MESDIEIGSDEEAYRDFIVFCEDTDEEKENLLPVGVSESGKNENETVARPYTRKDQFDKIINFTKGERLFQV